ncbi:MAG: GntR family transcriptional regulator [Burkholderiaceae bacterium]
MEPAALAAPSTDTHRGNAAAPPSVGDDIRQQLEHDIASGLLVPGARLDVKMVAERFGVSRTPAREALLQLSAAGLIDFQPRRGGRVTQLEPPEVLGMIEVLVVLEAHAARLAARRMDEAQRRALAAAHAEAGRAAAAGDAAGYADANLRLHQLIYQGSGNGCLNNQIVQLRGRLAAHHPLSFERPGRMKSSHAEHQAIVQAVIDGDEAAAEAAMSTHITVGGTAQAEMLLRWASAQPRSSRASRTPSSREI